MGVLDDAIREHLELKRRHGASDAELTRQESEALGPARRDPAPAAAEPAEQVQPEQPVPAAAEPAPEPEPEPAADLADAEEPAAVAPAAPLPDEDVEPDEVPAEERLASEEERKPADEAEDVLEETPDFLQETPEHDRLWFEQKPPRDFDFDG